VVAGDAEPVEVLLRQVHPAQVEVLADVPDEVGELECQPQLPGRLAGGRRVGRAENRQHHGADDGRGALHVVEQVVVARVRGDRQIHRHAVQERREVVRVQGERVDRVQHRRQQRVVDVGPVETPHETLRPLRQPGGPLVGGEVGGGVDDLVRVPREAVEGVHVLALPRRKQPGGQVVRPAVLAVQPPALGVGGCEYGLHGSPRHRNC
jgi:hypothetical protein